MGAVVSAESLEIPPPGDELVARRAFDAPPKKRPFGLDFSAFNALIPPCGLGDDVMAAAESMGANDPEEEFMWCKEELAPCVTPLHLLCHMHDVPPPCCLQRRVR